MPISDELEALRRSNLVKAKSTRLSAEVDKHGFHQLDPEILAKQRKDKIAREKQARIDAQKANHSGARGAAINDLNLLYKKLIREQRQKKLEATQSLHGWRKKDYKLKEGEERGESPTHNVEEESAMLAMLPENVVATLKAKYETDNAQQALSMALKEDSEGGDGKEGGGILAQLMELPTSPVNADKIEEEEEKENEKEEKEEVTEEKKEPEEEKKEKLEEIKEDTKEEPNREEEEPATKTEEEAPKEEEAEKAEEEKEPKETEAEEEETKEEPAAKEEEAPPKVEPKEKDPSTVDPILQTRRFYNLHAQEFVDNISPRLALAPTTQRDAFLSKLQSISRSDGESITLLDLGCGHGRDAAHFTSLGHAVLGVDSSHEMLAHAKKLAPKAHYLNMDMRECSEVILSQSLDGIWAHGSLWHLPKADIVSTLRGLVSTIRPGGVLYLSLKLGNDGNNDEVLTEESNNGEVFDIDERYTATPQDLDETEDECDSRRKLYSYYASAEEVREMVTATGWEVMECEEDDRRGGSDYVTHSTVVLFATTTTAAAAATQSSGTEE